MMFLGSFRRTLFRESLSDLVVLVQYSCSLWLLSWFERKMCFILHANSHMTVTKSD